MSANYYCLVAGLRDYALDADTKGFDARAIIDDITGQLTDADAASLRKLLLFNDVGNLLNYRAGRSSFSTIGNFSREQIEQESVRPELLPEPIAKVVEAYDNPDDTDAWADHADDARPGRPGAGDRRRTEGLRRRRDRPQGGRLRRLR